MFLLETQLLLDLRLGLSGGCPPGLLAWAGGDARQRLFLSVVALMECERGAIAARRRGGEGAAAAWRHWIDDQLLPAFEGRILPIDAAVARRQATLSFAEQRDALMAATALEHSLTLATYQPRHFRPARVKAYDPRGHAPELESDWREAARTGSHWLKNLFVRA